MIRKTVYSYCAQCQSACPIVCTVENGTLVRVAPDRGHPNASRLCPKGVAGPELVHHPERLKHPLVRTRPKTDPNPGWKRVSWNEALDLTAARLSEIKKTFGAHTVVFNRPGPGGSPSRDYAPFVVRLANAFGSPNTLATGHVCQWHRDTCSKYTFGWQSVPQADYAHTRMVIVWGHNPHASIRCNVRDILNARRRGAKLVVIDPRRTPVAEESDLWLQIRPGTDGALILGLIHLLMRNRTYDADFVRHWTNAPFLVDTRTGRLARAENTAELYSRPGFLYWDEQSDRMRVYDPRRPGSDFQKASPALFKTVEMPSADGRYRAQTAFSQLKGISATFDPASVAGITRLPERRILELADMIGRIRPMCYFSYNGLEQHTNASQTNRALCVLYAMTGNLDVPGGNVFFPSPGGLKVRNPKLLPDEKHRLRLGHDRRPLGPAGFPNSSAQAYEVFNTLLSNQPYALKAMVAFGGNIITSNANSIQGREALRRLNFFVQTELFMTPSAELADIVLPAATFFESSALKVGFPNLLQARQHVQLRRQVIAPLQESKPDTDIIFELAQRLGLSEQFWGGSYQAALGAQARAVGLDLDTLKRHARGVSIPLEIAYRKYALRDPASDAAAGFNTPSGLVEIFCPRFQEHGHDPLPQYREPKISPESKPDWKDRYPLILTCNKLLHYCHGQHRALPMLRRAVPHPFVEIHPQTAETIGTARGDWVYVETPFGKMKCRAAPTPRIAPGMACIQHGWWQACNALNLPGYDPYSGEGANANLLYSTDEIDDLSGSVPYKAYLCRIVKG